MKKEKQLKGYVIRGFKGWLMPWTFRIVRKDTIREIERSYGEEWRYLKKQGYEVVKGTFKPDTRKGK
jgi:hypothetical protein